MQKKIVVVDDDPGAQDTARIIFERAGYNTFILHSPKPLYDHEHTDADIILLDRQLGEYDGLEVCRDLKQQPEFANMPILLMSATSYMPPNLADCMADGFIEKPFRKKELLERIEKLLLAGSVEAPLLPAK